MNKSDEINHGQPASVAPTTGLQAGALLLALMELAFLMVQSLIFGASPCIQVTFVSATQLNCTTPANVAGTVTVSVLNSDGQTGGTPGFTYSAIPIIGFQVGLIGPNHPDPDPDPDSYGSTTTNVTHTFAVINTGEGRVW